MRRSPGPEGRVKFDVVDRGGLTEDDAEIEAGHLVFEASDGNVAERFCESVTDGRGYNVSRWAGFSAVLRGGGLQTMATV